MFFLKFKATAQTGVPVPELSAFDSEINTFLEKWQIPGATVALAKNDKLLYAKGFGLAADTVAMQPDNLFRIASLSKPVTAIAIMKLVQDNVLAVDDHVFGRDGILNSPKYSNYTDPRIETITVQNLLEHSGGWDRDISQEGDPMFNSVKIAKVMNVPAPAGPATIIQYMLRQPLDFTPGTRFAYSNFGYSILGRIIEKVTNQSYEAYVRQAILEPLHIKNMYLGRNLYQDRKAGEVKYFDLKNRYVKSVSDAGKKVPFQYGGFNLEAMDAHGGWIASAPALTKLLVGLNPAFPNAPLNQETIKIMTQPSVANSNYAKGWFVNRQGNLWHTGALIGTSSLMASLNNGLKWVLLLNARPEDPGFYNELDQLMWKAVAKIKTWPNQDLWELEKEQQMALQMEPEPQIQ